MSQTYNVAVIAGDGIGKEVMPEGLKIVKAAAGKFGLNIEFHTFEWGGCDYYETHGKMMPDDWKDQVADMDAIYFGAVGWPASVPDHISLWGSILTFRREFDQYINMRPVRTFEGVKCALSTPKADDIDFLVVRENTEGEYSAIGGIMYEGTDREVVMQQSVFTRYGTDRVLRYAFETAKRREAKSLTVATKSNGMAISMPWWDSRAEAVSEDYPEISWDKQHIDILSARFVMQPERFDVVVASNLFGDILSDLGPACTGTIGLAPSANLNPERKFPSLFEPVHGSAPDIYGKNIANPIGMIWSGALMLSFLTHDTGAGKEAHDAIVTAIEHTLKGSVVTPDLGGEASTQAMGEAILANL
ncbi:tartrate dehydrogenase/decarboxylase / D-malate dehydrogenase [Marisediminitalea aggregata]|uniref:D-malate dehydrogenase (decarboxylating) n=1 Tax=Marisediminitalea aggregata TaxID=634436 RepID=A0A1M5F2R5_9ALTE|nr:tartrate dehydrogenase [Marisediminitalea aggregata]SHF85834.1 tartrate dehydrogenase/decarboxylase / D-malate dehydrogenase [Marisediminitalea aggregata]